MTKPPVKVIAVSCIRCGVVSTYRGRYQTPDMIKYAACPKCGHTHSLVSIDSTDKIQTDNKVEFQNPTVVKSYADDPIVNIISKLLGVTEQIISDVNTVKQENIKLANRLNSHESWLESLSRSTPTDFVIPSFEESAVSKMPKEVAELISVFARYGYIRIIKDTALIQTLAIKYPKIKVKDNLTVVEQPCSIENPVPKTNRVHFSKILLTPDMIEMLLLCKQSDKSMFTLKKEFGKKYNLHLTEPHFRGLIQRAIKTISF